VPTTDGGVLRTIAEARDYMLALPHKRAIGQSPCSVPIRSGCAGLLGGRALPGQPPNAERVHSFPDFSCSQCSVWRELGLLARPLD
jgi:hypothetical protein